MRTTLPLVAHMVSVLVLQGRGAATRVLALQRASPHLNGAWSYVGGHAEDGENGWQTARRELAEETGIVDADWYATTFCEQFYAAASGCIEVVPAFVAYVAADAPVRLNREHSAWRWVSFEEAAELFPFGSQRELLAHVRREFVQRSPAPFLHLLADGADPELRGA